MRISVNFPLDYRTGSDRNPCLDGRNHEIEVKEVKEVVIDGITFYIVTGDDRTLNSEIEFILVNNNGRLVKAPLTDYDEFYRLIESLNDKPHNLNTIEIKELLGNSSSQPSFDSLEINSFKDTLRNLRQNQEVEYMRILVKFPLDYRTGSDRNPCLDGRNHEIEVKEVKEVVIDGITFYIVTGYDRTLNSEIEFILVNNNGRLVKAPLTDYDEFYRLIESLNDKPHNLNMIEIKELLGNSIAQHPSQPGAQLPPPPPPSGPPYFDLPYFDSLEINSFKDTLRNLKNIKNNQEIIVFTDDQNHLYIDKPTADILGYNFDKTVNYLPPNNKHKDGYMKVSKDKHPSVFTHPHIFKEFDTVIFHVDHENKCFIDINFVVRNEIIPYDVLMNSPIINNLVKVDYKDNITKLMKLFHMHPDFDLLRNENIDYNNTFSKQFRK